MTTQITAYDLFNAAFDSSADGRDSEDAVQYLKDYADAVFDSSLSDADAQIILDQKKIWEEANDEDGQWSQNRYIHIEKPLSEIIIREGVTTDE